MLPSNWKKGYSTSANHNHIDHISFNHESELNRSIGALSVPDFHRQLNDNPNSNVTMNSSNQIHHERIEYINPNGENYRTREKHECEFCHRIFGKRTLLTTHMKIHRKLKCSICFKTFNRRAALESHKIIHELNGSEVSDENEKSNDNDNGTLYNSLYDSIIKSGKTVQSRKYYNGLNYENEWHGSSRGQLYNLPTTPSINNHSNIECPICHKKFTMLTSLNIHLKLHRKSRNGTDGNVNHINMANEGITYSRWSNQKQSSIGSQISDDSDIYVDQLRVFTEKVTNNNNSNHTVDDSNELINSKGLHRCERCERDFDMPWKLDVHLRSPEHITKQNLHTAKNNQREQMRDTSVIQGKENKRNTDTVSIMFPNSIYNKQKDKSSLHSENFSNCTQKDNKSEGSVVINLIDENKEKRRVTLEDIRKELKSNNDDELRSTKDMNKKYRKLHSKDKHDSHKGKIARKASKKDSLNEIDFSNEYEIQEMQSSTSTNIDNTRFSLEAPYEMNTKCSNYANRGVETNELVNNHQRYYKLPDSSIVDNRDINILGDNFEMKNKLHSSFAKNSVPSVYLSNNDEFDKPISNNVHDFAVTEATSNEFLLMGNGTENQLKNCEWKLLEENTEEVHVNDSFIDSDQMYDMYPSTNTKTNHSVIENMESEFLEQTNKFKNIRISENFDVNHIQGFKSNNGSLKDILFNRISPQNVYIKDNIVYAFRPIVPEALPITTDEQTHKMTTYNYQHDWKKNNSEDIEIELKDELLDSSYI